MSTKPDKHPRSAPPESVGWRPSPGGGPTPGETARPTPREIGGPKGPEPTRYGDWEVNGRCTDF